MTIATYADLLSAVPSWAFRTGDAEFEARVPGFIALNEARLNMQVRVRQMEASATITLDADGRGALPADYLEFRRVVGGAPERVLSPATPGHEFALGAGGIGTARTFSISGNTISTYPATAGEVDLLYYAKIPALGTGNPSNWLLASHPNIYLYGTLIETAPFMMDDQALQRWSAMYDRAMTDLTLADQRARYARGVVRAAGPTP